MAGLNKFIAFAVAIGLCAVGARATTVTEHFDNNTDSSWDHVNNTTPPQNYAWSNSDNTGTNLGGSGAGELGGVITRVTEGDANANFYGFNIGSIDPATTGLTASGLYNIATSGGSSGLLIGFFKDRSSFSHLETDPIAPHHNDDPADFLGIYFIDGTQPRGELYDPGGFEDRTGVLTTLTAGGSTVPFSITWSPPPAGSSNKGSMSVTVNGFTQSVDYSGDPYDAMQHFGVMSAGHAGGSDTFWVDDLTFTSNNPIPEPASLGLLSVCGLALLRRRRA